jgi:hypothetical protein
MLHAWVQRFDVTDGRGNILGSERALKTTWMTYGSVTYEKSTLCLTRPPSYSSPATAIFQ